VSPHFFTQNPRLQPAEFLIIGAKRLLQQYPANNGHSVAAQHLSKGAKKRHFAPQQKPALLSAQNCQ
jgi:hypothetical protein